MAFFGSEVSKDRRDDFHGIHEAILIVGIILEHEIRTSNVKHVHEHTSHIEEITIDKNITY